MFFNGQTGQPYSLIFNGDANGDASSTNDIAFIPGNTFHVARNTGMSTLRIFYVFPTDTFDEVVYDFVRDG